MTRAETFIKTLEDFELAFLQKYKLGTYMKPTQDLILTEIHDRGLLDTQLDDFIEKIENNPKNTGCPRCNSNKIRTENIKLQNKYYGGGDYGGVGIAYTGSAVINGQNTESKGNRVVCEVCNFTIKDDNKSNFFIQLWTKLMKK